MQAVWQRLRERKLVQWALAYLAGAWLLFQVVSLLGAAFAWSRSLLRIFVVVLAVGFIGALILAWYHGEKGRQRVSGPELVMMATLLFIAGGVLWLVGSRSPPAAGETSRAQVPERIATGPDYEASVAVLPFDEVGAGKEEAYFGEGITEEIINELAKVEGLKVISRTSVVALKGSNLTLPQIADTLGVRHVVEGSVRRAGKRVRVSVQLIEAKTDAHLWAESYDRELTDIFSVQEGIARQVSGALLRTVRGLRPRAASSRTEDAAAYDAYLRGTYARQRRTRDGLLNAIKAFEEAMTLDSTYAPAYAGLSAAHALWVVFGYIGELDSYQGLARALALAERAIALDSSLAEGYAARGIATVFAWGSQESALSDLERAVRLAPTSGELQFYAVGLAYSGQYEDALAEIERAIALDPLDPGRRGAFSSIALGARRYDIVLRETRRALLLEPRFLVPLKYEAAALLLLGRAEECAELDVGPYAAFRAMCLYSSGDTARAAALIDSLSIVVQAGAPRSLLQAGHLAGDIATYYAWVGDARASLHWLREAAERSPPSSYFRFLDSGLFDRVREAPGFRSELERIRDRVRARLKPQ